ncbi:class I SAM-dependent methyltransferase [Consotaella salsifontis]|uniref:Methyltransferase domain-containing protein n=1 Tax=Consotaella salsifontis TaxID=1365950 RepID=A0A1T4T4S6_9HYPH|nr:class I SAM-dependent methyltransferase [Consotaella salsifontis]SKA35397.1 hypothetical protein SAMN05428963_1196 [Consotaella salsifontis]
MSRVRVVFDGESLITPDMVAATVAAPATPQADEEFRAAEVQLALTMAITQQRFEAGSSPAEVASFLVEEMRKMRASLDPGVWQKLLPIAQAHPINRYLLQDPFTRWSVEKPRGYSGDAQLLDFVYEHPSVADAVAETTELGRGIYSFTHNAPTAAAARERLEILGRQVDTMAEERGGNLEVLTIASGHLREGLKSTALKEGRLKRWVALDQDPISIGSINRDFAGTAVEAIDGSVKGVLAGSYALGTFDLVYAAGLYDYLPRAVAIRLTRACLKYLKPGGVFLFANYHRDLPDEGYMEAFMNWALVLRTEEEMWEIVNRSVDRNEADANVFYGENRAILYGTIARKD